MNEVPWNLWFNPIINQMLEHSNTYLETQYKPKMKHPGNIIYYYFITTRIM